MTPKHPWGSPKGSGRRSVGSLFRQVKETPLVRTTRRSSETDIDEIANGYVDRCPWVSADAIKLSLQLEATTAARRAAGTRFYQSRGLERSLGRHALLRALYFADEFRLPQYLLGAEMKVTSAGVTFLVDGLEKDGLVERIAHPADRRMTYVQLTDEGRKFCEVLVPAMAEFMTDINDILTAEERTALNELLSKLRRHAEESYRAE